MSPINYEVHDVPYIALRYLRNPWLAPGPFAMIVSRHPRRFRFALPLAVCPQGTCGYYPHPSAPSHEVHPLRGYAAHSFFVSVHSWRFLFSRKGPSLRRHCQCRYENDPFPMLLAVSRQSLHARREYTTTGWKRKAKSPNCRGFAIAIAPPQSRKRRMKGTKRTQGTKRTADSEAANSEQRWMRRRNAPERAAARPLRASEA